MLGRGLFRASGAARADLVCTRCSPGIGTRRGAATGIALGTTSGGDVGGVGSEGVSGELRGGCACGDADAEAQALHDQRQRSSMNGALRPHSPDAAHPAQLSFRSWQRSDWHAPQLAWHRTIMKPGLEAQ